ncbi:AGAP011769-PA-like protein [Anopheles sinensis]|uniref:AGAP011769-PA-like protein n=1 Tax=Anopheles sinensis TaxID=74873 RepID=A0A084WJ52_ANOSI|nr:AGAP011769-PA-like protein [Anopheles sinensis]
MNDLYSQTKRRRQGLSGNLLDRDGNDDDPYGTQFSVPSSQAPSQRRYLSQRSNLQRSHVVRTGRRTPSNYYESVLLMAGLSLDEPAGVVVLKCEPIVFMHKLKSVLRTNPDYPANVDRFIAGIELTMKDRTNFLKLLECCQVMPTAPTCPNQTLADPVRKPVQESLMKMFLLVDFLQLKLIELLFAYLLKELDMASAGDTTAEDSIVGFVLSQLKFIDQVQNGELVFEKVFQLLAKVKRETVIFDEIILSLEDVIDVSKHDEALHRLMKLRPRPEDIITPTTVEVFTEMCLSVETLEMLRRKVVQYASDGCQLRYYPALVKMLLKFNRTEPPENIASIIREVRKLLDTGGNPEAWKNGPTADDCAEQVLRTIYQAISASAVLFDAWIAAIRQLPAAEDHLPFDLLLLTIAMTTNELKAPRIRKQTVKKIEQQFFTEAHTDQLVSGCFRRVLQMHLDGFLQLIECCTREKNEHVCEFGVSAMSALFSLDHTIAATDNRVVLSKIVGFICEMASGNVGSRNDFLIGRCITALRKLHESHPKAIERSAELLLKILDIAPDLTLRQYRPLIGVIYAAAIPPNGGEDPELTSIRDNLEIIVKKQLLCDNKDTKKKGIIGLVQMVYHISLAPETDGAELSSSFDSERTIGTVSDIPSAKGRSLANLISTLLLSTNQSADLLAICYDELAGMFAQTRPRSAPGWEKTFIMWLCDTITMDFQSHFLVEDATPLPTKESSRDGTAGPGIRLDRKLCITTGEEASTNAEAATIALNIGGGVIAFKSRHSVITFLMPIFRLMRTLHAIRYEGTLESINALLSCAIVVPDFYGIPAEEDRRFTVDAFDEGLCTQLLDIYFYLGNWFRECISAFVGQQDAIMRSKASNSMVLERLQELVKLEHHLGRMLDRMSAECEYVPPLAVDLIDGGSSISLSKKLKPSEPAKGRSKAAAARDKTINLDAPLGSQTAAAATMPATVGQFNEQSLLLRCGFAVRQMDPELARLLEVPLKPVRVLDAVRSQDVCLVLPEYRFVLENLTIAMEQRPEQQCCQRRVMDRWGEFIERMALVGGRLREGINRLQPASPQELLPLKSCYLWSLRLATALLSWKRFREPRGRADLERVIDVMVRKLCTSDPAAGDAGGSPGHLNDQIKLLLKELIVREACFGDVSIAAQMYRLACALGECAGDRSGTNRDLARFTRSVLTAPDLRSPDAKSNQHFVTLLDGLMGSIGLKSLKQLVVEMHQDVCKLEEEGKKDKSKSNTTTVRTFASFKRSHYTLFFRGLCRAFIRLLQDEIRIRSGGGASSSRRLELWEMACEATGELTNVVRRAQQATNFGVYLRFAQIFIKLFLRNGLPVLETILRSSAERASNLLSTLQITTRYLHSICCQAKISKGSGGAAAAVSQIPFVRESVETLVYRVKAALVANHCSAVFWMGNLKNKDMQGELITSQLEPEPESDAEEVPMVDDITLAEDDDIPSDDGEQPGDSLGGRKRPAPQSSRSSHAGSGSLKSSQSKCF